MATYAIGDVQGCHRELLALLDLVNFDPRRDRLWFVGDLVNRGPDSLSTLRWVRSLGDGATTVLGNHDLHLLACAAGVRQSRAPGDDTLAPVLAAPDRDRLLDWLAQRPLLHHDAEAGYTLLHAGLPPQWDLELARECAAEAEGLLRGPERASLLRHMQGDRPRRWTPRLAGWERARFILNCLTRMRYCDADGRLALNETGTPGAQPPALLPWFQAPQRRSRGLRIVFGHWSTLGLNGRDYREWGVYPLDDGCVWGGSLTALRLEDRRRFRVPSRTRAALPPGGGAPAR